ncbi:MAG: LssY C-terminal domain-containing protein [Elusimicrobia bacterium]|nr:LssY C-terminal domain-containing protein [Elusimicrobiota bacterium]
MKKLAAIGAFILFGSITAVFFSDILFPLGSTYPSPRTVTSTDLHSLLKVLPGRDIGRGTREGDPMNLAFWGTDGEVREALQGTGWTEVPLRLGASLRAGTAQLLTGRKVTMFPPFNLYQVLSRTQDMNWAMVDKPLVSRHHFRLWRTGFTDRGGRQLWWGSGNRDLSIRWSDLSHRPDPDMDAEREFIAKSLEGSALVRKLSRHTLPQIPLSGANDKGYAFRTDGRVLLVELAVPGTPGPGPVPAKGPGPRPRR